MDEDIAWDDEVGDEIEWDKKNRTSLDAQSDYLKVINTPRPKAPGWGSVLKDIPVAAARDTADAMLAFGPNVANLATAAGGLAAETTAHAGRGLGLPIPQFDPPEIPFPKPATVADLGWERPVDLDGMTDAQKVAHTAGEFGLLTAMSPVKAGQQVAANPGAMAALKGLLTSPVAKNAALGAVGGGAAEATTQMTGSPMAGLAAGLLTPMAAVGAGRLTNAAGRLGADLANVRGKNAPDYLASKMAGDSVASESEPFFRQIVDALRNSRAAVPGLQQNAAQAVAAPQVGVGKDKFGAGLFRLYDEVKQSPLTTLESQQAAQMTGLLEDMAGGVTRDARKAVQGVAAKARDAETDPLFKRATGRADEAGAVLPGLLGDLDKLKATQVNALQQEGQMLTEAAQQANRIVPRVQLGNAERDLLVSPPLHQGGPAPGTVIQPGARTLPGRFPQSPADNPFAIPRIPEEGITGQALADRTAKLPIARAAKETASLAARDAAGDLRAIFNEAKGDQAMIEDQINRLAFNGQKPLEVKPLIDRLTAAKRDPIARGSKTVQTVLDDFIDRIKASVNDDGKTVPAESLATIRAEANVKIGELKQGNPKVDDKQATRRAMDLKSTIDDAITSAGGDTWREALTRFGRYSDEISSLKAKEGLLNSFRGADERVTPASFLRDTDIKGDGAAKFVKRLGLDPKQTNLKKLLGDDYEMIMSVREQLRRDLEIENVAKGTGSTRPGPRDSTKAPQVPNQLDPTIAKLNFILRVAAGRNEPMAIARLNELLKDPAGLAARLEKNRIKPVVPSSYQGLLGMPALQ